ncbi:MAG TPA: hypothetical protein VG675_14075 [Bryobacteraceae bacterium]|nr:hypothetical protein [Bryobacteraceae bacterium]
MDSRAAPPAPLLYDRSGRPPIDISVEKNLDFSRAEAGMDTYVSKPIRMEALNAVLVEFGPGEAAAD